MLRKCWKKQYYENSLARKGQCLFAKLDELCEMLSEDYPRQQIVNKAHDLARVNTEINDLMMQAHNDGIELNIEAEAYVKLPWEE